MEVNMSPRDMFFMACMVFAVIKIVHLWLIWDNFQEEEEEEDL
jgi:hypothetical protein